MNLPDFLTSRCKDPVRPAKWGKVWLVHHPEQICQVLRRPLSFGKGGELWKLEPSGDITLWPKDARVRVGGDVLDGV